MNSKSFVIALVALTLLIPLGLGVFNHYIGRRNLGVTFFPHEILGEDHPLKSRMYLKKNYTGYSYHINIHNGFEKITYTLNDMGFRIPKVDFSKEIVLMGGDSVLFGSGLNDWETVPYLLQEKTDLNVKFSFFNAGIPGKSIPHHLLTLQNIIELSKKRSSRIKYFMMWVSFNDFEENISLEKIRNRSLKQNLSLKDQLASRFPTLAVFYKSLRDRKIGDYSRRILSRFLIQTKPYRYERIPQNVPAQTRRERSNSKVVEENLGRFRNLIELCDAHGILLINVIVPWSYNDIFYENGSSEYLEDILRGLGQKHIVKLKDIYHTHPEDYPGLAGRGHEFVHFSYKAAQLIADHLTNYLNELETS